MMRRREFITLLGGAAAAWPLTARAQQAAMPVIGFLHRETPAPWWEGLIAVMKRSLAEMDYVEGRNFVIEYRWAEGQTDRLPALAADLVRRKVAVIVAPGNTPTALAAKAATETIPIVFSVGTDPVESGLVESLNRPGGNVTGISVIDIEMIAKRVQLLHQLVPTATSIALLVNPRNPITAQAETREVQIAAHALGLRMLVLNASNRDDIAIAFAKLLQEQAGALVVSHEVFFSTVHDQLIELAMRHKIPMSTHSSGRSQGCSRSLWTRSKRYLAPHRHLCGSSSKRRKASRSSGSAFGEARSGHQPQDRQGAGHRSAAALLARADEVIE